MRSLSFLTFFFLTVSYTFLSLQAQSNNWYDGKRTSETPYNIGTDEIYEKVIKGKKGQSVVVAVIDSGVDIEHEDLADVIWVNHREIPGNGIDDDNNGYIDDIHGWNFIGGKDGFQVGADSYEMVRVYASLKVKYNNADPSKLSDKELEEYNEFNKFGKKIETEVTGAKANYEKFEQEAEILFPVMDLLEEIAAEKELDEELMEYLAGQPDRNSMIAANVLNYFLEEVGSIPTVAEIRTEIAGPIEDALKHYGTKWKYHYNPDYNPRVEIGDNYEDMDDRYYGNNMVEGPDAFHGTHVSGIIAATRNNNIGINGIANNAKIMVLRAVPDGDERDKDVANAIRYAVENGASVINMSFGKGQSPNKEAVDEAVRYAEKNDVLMVHAAGNANLDLDESDNFPNDYFKKPKGFLFWKKKKPKNWITVGASGPSKGDELAASFSNYGDQDVDVFAPGVMMFSTTPNNQYQIAQGTSMAAPVISGVAALLRSYFPTLTAEQIKEVLVESTTANDVLVKKPGSQELVPFSTLSKSGGVIDIENAFALASKTKGKKKIRKIEVRA